MKILIYVLFLAFSTVTFADYDGLTCHPHNDGWDGWFNMDVCTGVPWEDPMYCPSNACPDWKCGDGTGDDRNKNHDPNLSDSKFLFLPYRITHDEFRIKCIDDGVEREQCEAIVEVMLSCG